MTEALHPFYFLRRSSRPRRVRIFLIINFVVFGPFVVRSVVQLPNLSSARFAILDPPSSILDPRLCFDCGSGRARFYRRLLAFQPSGSARAPLAG